MRSAHHSRMLSSWLPKHRHAARRAPAATCAALISILAPVPSGAAEGAIVLPLYDVPSVTHAIGDRVVDTPNPAPGSVSASRPRSAELPRATANFALVEMPPEVALPGSGYKRPHHAVGYRWLAAESWLRDHGFDAQTCYLPMLRMHTKLSASSVSGTLWVYGRCTFR